MTFEASYNNPIKLDLDNPIFVFYINVEGLSIQQSEEAVNRVISDNQYSNVTIWWMTTTTSPSKIECVYDGGHRKRKTELIDLIKQINSRIDVLSKSTSFDDFRIQIRDWRINNLLDGDN